METERVEVFYLLPSFLLFLRRFFSRRSALGKGGKALGCVVFFSLSFFFRGAVSLLIRVSFKLRRLRLLLLLFCFFSFTVTGKYRPPFFFFNPTLRSPHFSTNNMENPGERRKTTEEMGQGRDGFKPPPLLQINNIAPQKGLFKERRETAQNQSPDSVSDTEKHGFPSEVWCKMLV